MPGILNKILWPAEIIAYVITAIGVAMNNDILMIGMSVLAASYFLRAYVPKATQVAPATESEEERKQDFFDLLATSIGVKTAWLGCAVVVEGSLFRLLHLNGALEMLMVGISVLVATMIIMGLHLLIRTMNATMPSVLYRAVPVCLLGLYLFINPPL